MKTVQSLKDEVAKMERNIISMWDEYIARRDAIDKQYKGKLLSQEQWEKKRVDMANKNSDVVSPFHEKLEQARLELSSLLAK